MKKIHKIGLAVLAACVCLCLAACGDSKDGFTWKVDDATKTITVEGIGILPEVDEKKYPDEKYGDYTLIFGDGITGVSNSFRFGQYVMIGRSMNDITPLMSTDWYYTVSEENPFYASYEGALYTKDFAELLKYPRYKEPNDFHPGLVKIGNYAFYRYCGPYGEGGQVDTIIIPWGVTTVGNQIFGSPSTNIKYVIPDTVVRFGTASVDESGQGFYPIWVPSRNNSAAWDAWPGTGQMRLAYVENNYEALEYVPYHNIASYYDIQSNSLKKFEDGNGKTYYFDQYYNMVKGWKQVNGNWYFFNDYGAASVKTWLEKDGKQVFLDEDGVMATNRWVDWYGKSYYVGLDGGMYINQETPDGYRVDGEGARIG
ncbi:MAG: hypothetical protein DBY45_02245 [Clostridiales bacterium]|nr:MAG: hypothetical protein DBY45_02245 [Clostridiales bacterium]